MGGAQAMKRIPRIKFPQRHPKPSEIWNLRFTGSVAQSLAPPTAADANMPFFSGSKASSTRGGQASLQPKRTPVSNEEIEAILLGGCI